MTHFVFCRSCMAVLWATSHRQWVRFMKRFATLLGVACLMFVVVPTVPPWMAAARSSVPAVPRLHRNAGRGFTTIGFHSFRNDY